MKFYIASKFENAEQVKRLSDVLRRWGWRQTYDWTEHGHVGHLGKERLREVAENEIRGVKDADVVIILLPGGRGTHAELGAANVLQKPVFILSGTGEPFAVDNSTCAFYWNRNVKQVTGELIELMGELLAFHQSLPREEVTYYYGDGRILREMKEV